MHAALQIVVLSLCVGLSPCAVYANDQSDRLAFGPLIVGMSLDEAQAAAPDIQWTVLEAHPTTRRAYVVKGRSAVSIADVKFDVEIGSRAIGAKVWDLESTRSVASVAECHRHALAVAIELERRFGSFELRGNVIDGEAVFPFGKASRGKITAAERLRPLKPEQALKNDPQDFWFQTFHRPVDENDLDARVRAHYQRDKGRSCEIGVELEGYEAPPAGLGVVFDESRAISRPRIGFRTSSLRSIGVPKETLRFVVPCRISAATGKIGACTDGPAGMEIDPHRKLASRWALRYQLRLNNPRLDDERFFDIDVPIAMGPQDIRTIDVTEGTMLDMRLAVVETFPRQEIDESYLQDVRRLKAPAEIEVRCKVQEDGSALCALKPGTASPSKRLTAAAIEMTEWIELNPKLRDGSPAAGKLFDRVINFYPKRKGD